MAGVLAEYHLADLSSEKEDFKLLIHKGDCAGRQFEMPELREGIFSVA